MPHFVYFISDGEYTKIGIANNVGQRLYSLQTANARKLSLVHSIELPDASYAQFLEQRLHKHFVDKRAIGEWFKLNWLEAKPDVDYLYFSTQVRILNTKNNLIQVRFNSLVAEDLEQNFPPISRRFIFKESRGK